MSNTQEEDVFDLTPDADATKEKYDHHEVISDEEAELGEALYYEIDDLDDQSNGLDD